MASPPGSPAGVTATQRPMSAMIRQNRSSSRMSMSSKHGGGGSRASDEDGKTAVKVAVRVRPPLKATDPGYELIPQRFRGSTCSVTSCTSLAVDSGQGKKLFVFDRVFSEDVDQSGVWDYLKESVNSFVEGYNVSILAYGQSGAGKSYTMGTTGPAEQADPTLMGVVPRAASVLFEKLTGQSNRMSTSGLKSPKRYSTLGFQSVAPPQHSSNANRNWQMRATYVEIYQEQLRDLLLSESVPQGERPQIAIREDTKGRILLTGLQQVTINSVEDLLNALNFGSSIRQTDATAVNARSSRSHAVFSLNLVQKRTRFTSVQDKRRSVPVEAMSGESWVTVDSKLHFVDLAGSERLKNTQAYGERAKEGISINAGLASLGKVISQLSSRHAGAHVSYRDSRLTRLLQDSLGGNAITYMVACINPAEFHLSETLNTVQYAQRARAIQSRPQIQQVNDDSDKHATIERLRAEVNFLRDQIRMSERGGRRDGPVQEVNERHGEREQELQNQLLDIQENYRALSNRHAKLISEITKARDGQEGDTPALTEAIGENAVARLKRSTDFGEAVEQVVLEYEKTIQSLEGLLSSTRSTLSTSESSLLEKETKLAYMESVQQQLQARIQKAMDREANDENYLRDLESRVAGATSGEEKSTAVIQSLRKELARARENEAGCEDYISTLEERLAESEQDQEMREREIQRLEHVIERQRSIGKLDNLLYELDNIRRNDSRDRSDSRPAVNGHVKNDSFQSIQEDVQGERAPEAHTPNGDILEEEAGVGADAETVDKATSQEAIAEEAERPSEDLQVKPNGAVRDTPQSPAQSQFVADKLESVTQELFDLRMEHETTVNDLDELQRKYQVALNTLAEMQDAVDEARHAARPSSFLADAGVNGTKQEDGQPSSSRTLSSELSLHGESPESVSASSEEAAQATGGSDKEVGQVAEGRATPVAVRAEEEEPPASVEKYAALQKSHSEQEETMTELSKQYVALQEQHQETLDYVEELKAEVQRAQMARPSSPQALLRRKSSQVMTTDKANRSAHALRSMVHDSFEEEPDRIQVFEANINSLVHELQSRTERVAALEGDLASVREEMEGKMKIISGLTRERSSLKSSTPIDISVVASMQHQLNQTEQQIRSLQDSHNAREQELQEQIEKLKSAISNGVAATPGVDAAPGGFPATPAEDGQRELSIADDHDQRIVVLQKELDEWKSKHNASLESMKSSEEQMLSTIRQLETSLKQARIDSPTVPELKERSASVSSSELASLHANHQEVIDSLRKEVEEYKTVAAENAARVAELDTSYQNILKQVEGDAAARQLTEKELETHKRLVSNLETQLEEHKRSMSMQQDGLQAIKDGHAKEIDQMKLNSQKEADERLAAQMEEHQKALSSLQEELAKAQSESGKSSASLQDELKKAQNQLLHLVDSVAVAMNQETDAKNIESHVRQLANERKNLIAQHENVTSELAALRKSFESSQKNVDMLESKLEELKKINEETANELLRVSEEETKKSRLVEELEEQLSTNYDQHQAANNRLSALQSQRHTNLDEVLQARLAIEQELEDSKARISQLESQIGEKRNSQPVSRPDSGGGDPNLRKSTSHASLPSPPPAIPLPPLPGSPPSVPAPSPPTSRHTSKDIAQAQLVEDQEARIRTIEKHLFAEKQLTATLEEALTDLEASSTKLKNEMDGWRRKCNSLEDELSGLKKERNNARLSVQQLEEERNARMRLEKDRENLEERMKQLHNAQKKTKKSKINCF